MIPIIDEWVLVVDENNYMIARYLGTKKRKDPKGVLRDFPLYANQAYYTSLSAAFQGLRAQMERKVLREKFPGLQEAFMAVLESNTRLAVEFERIRMAMEGKK